MEGVPPGGTGTWHRSSSPQSLESEQSTQALVGVVLGGGERYDESSPFLWLFVWQLMWFVWHFGTWWWGHRWKNPQPFWSAESEKQSGESVVKVEESWQGRERRPRKDPHTCLPRLRPAQEPRVQLAEWGSSAKANDLNQDQSCCPKKHTLHFSLAKKIACCDEGNHTHSRKVTKHGIFITLHSWYTRCIPKWLDMWRTKKRSTFSEEKKLKHIWPWDEPDVEMNWYCHSSYFD